MGWQLPLLHEPDPRSCPMRELDKREDPSYNLTVGPEAQRYLALEGHSLGQISPGIYERRQAMYEKHYQIKRTPQKEKIPGTTQVQNDAGGFAWAVDDWVRLDRFLILGSEGGTYYVRERELTIQNAEAVHRCGQG